MPSRLKLYALSARNTLGKVFGIAGAYTPAQRATAVALWRIYRTKYNPIQSAALLGCNEGECAFILDIGGDKVDGVATAYGVGQWHRARRDDIQKHTGFDVWLPDANQQAQGLMAEMSTKWPGNIYAHVETHLKIATTTREAITILVTEYERSRLQQRDIDRRTPFADYWLAQNLDDVKDAA